MCLEARRAELHDATAIYLHDNRATFAPSRYDFLMGAILHPRLFGGRLDVKMFAEIRLSWFLLFILTASAAVKVVEEQGGGAPPLSLAFIVFAQFMYANATSKGEHYVPPTWDISYEKYGWMLCFWNFAGEL